MSTPTIPNPYIGINNRLVSEFRVRGLDYYDHLPPALYPIPAVYGETTGIEPGVLASDQTISGSGVWRLQIIGFVSLEQSPRVAEAQALTLAKTITTVMGVLADSRINNHGVSIESIVFDRAQLARDERPVRVVSASVIIQTSR